METSGKIAAHATFNGVASQFRSATTEVRGMLGTGDSNVEQIDFTNYNYPPFLNVIHYKLDELLPVKQPIVKRLNWLFLLTVLYTIINFINVLIMLFGGRKWTHLLLSILNMCALSSIGLTVFYTGYRAMVSLQKSIKFTIFSSIQFILFLIFAIVGTGAFNGLTNFGSRFNGILNGGMHGFMIYATIFETIICLVICGGLVFNWNSVRRFDPYLQQPL